MEVFCRLQNAIKMMVMNIFINILEKSGVNIDKILAMQK